MIGLYSNKKKKLTNFTQTWYVWLPAELNSKLCQFSR